MNWDTVQGKWTELSGQVRAKWGELIHDDMSHIEGKFDQLVGQLQQRYGRSKDRAERDGHAFLTSVPTSKPR